MNIKFTTSYFKVIAFAFAMTFYISGKAQIYWDFGTAASLSAYPASGIPANITVDSVTKGNSTGTPFLSTSSVSLGYPGASANGNAGVTAKIGALDYTVNATTGSAFYEITLTPNTGYYVSVTGMSFGSRSTGTGPKKYSIRVNTDGYATEVAGDTITSATSTWGLRTQSLSVAGTPGTALKIRIYGYAGAGAVSAINFRIDDLTLNAAAVSTGITADFNTTDVCFGTTASFTDASVSTTGTVNSWSWDFGDGSPLNTTQNPTHLYTAGGTYNVTLIAGDNLSNLDTTTSMIGVDSVASNLSVSLAGSVATFSGAGSNGVSPYSYLLNVGDGGGYSITTPNYVYTYSSPGTYTACLISLDILGCVDTSCTTFTILSTGISEKRQDLVSVFPNPSANGIFTIDAGASQSKTTVHVFNIVGKEILTKESTGISKQVIDLSSQANGSYFVRIQNDNGSVVKKVVINK
jgi:PKD repeat protein